MFIPTTEYIEFTSTNKEYLVPKANEVLLSDGSYKWVEDLIPGDILDTGEIVDHITDSNKDIKIYVM